MGEDLIEGGQKKPCQSEEENIKSQKNHSNLAVNEKQKRRMSQDQGTKADDDSPDPRQSLVLER